MQTHALGKTGLQVTPLGYGAMELRAMDPAKAETLLTQVLDYGINFIDTAPDYGDSEDFIGRFIANRRDDFILATKCGCNVPRVGGPTADSHIWTGEQLRHNIEHSLMRLNTDYIDVWQIHSADPDELVGTDVIETMQRIQEEGKVRHIAVSMRGQSEGYGYGQLKQYLDWDVFEAIQVWYGPFIRYSEDAISRAAAKGWGTIIRGVVRPPSDTTIGENFERAGLTDLLSERESPATFMLRFAFAHPDIHTVIVGTSNPQHLENNVRAVAAGPLPDDVMTEAKRRLDDAGYTVGM